MRRALASLLAVVAGCGGHVATPAPASVVLHGPDGAVVPLDAELRAHPATVVTFFSTHCPCQRAHDARLRALIAEAAARGVDVLVVDSEVTTSLATDEVESKARGYRILHDDDAKLARSLDAEYATYSVVLGPHGDVLYRGGFDSDRSHLKNGRQEYLKAAIDDVLGGRPVRRPEAKTLGCSLTLY